MKLACLVHCKSDTGYVTCRKNRGLELVTSQLSRKSRLLASWFENLSLPFASALLIALLCQMTEATTQWIPPATNISQEDVKAKMFTFLRNFDDHIRREKEAILSNRNQWIAQNAQDRGTLRINFFFYKIDLS